MDEKLKAQEPDTNLMATLWQPYGNLMATLWQPYSNLMIGLGKILRSKDIKSILNIRDIHFAETKNNTYLCRGFSLTFSMVIPLVRDCKRFVARHSNKAMFALALFSKGLDSRHRF